MKVGALCIKKEGVHFDTPSCFFTPIPLKTVWCSILKEKTLILAENFGTDGFAICPPLSLVIVG